MHDHVEIWKQRKTTEESKNEERAGERSLIWWKIWAPNSFPALCFSFQWTPAGILPLYKLV